MAVRARLIAWGIVVLTVACIPLTTLVVSQPHSGSLSIEDELSSPLAWMGVLAFSIVGALVVSRHPSSSRLPSAAPHEASGWSIQVWLRWP